MIHKKIYQLSLCYLLIINPLQAWEISGSVGIESLAFINQPLDAQQHPHYLSGVIEGELHHEWDEGNQVFAFVPYFRVSQYDNKRTHFDIRELTWVKSSQDWELRLGFRKVFWGVTESKHLVDIVNQRDSVENSDGEDKLGQPMINFAWIQEWGTLDLLLLTGFREMTFAGEQGRLRTQPSVNSDLAQFEKKGFERQVAYAVRWSHSMGDWDVGFSHFYGTSRDPLFLVKTDDSGQVSLIPYYENINQSSLDIQATIGNWLWKGEAMLRDAQSDRTFASTLGFEYTFFNIANSGLDIGLLTEYSYDSRGVFAPSLLQDDFFVGLRFALNDVQDTQILAGIMIDRVSQAQFYNIEASRRFFESFTVDIQARFFNGAPPNDPSYFLRNDSHFRMEMTYHF